MLPSLHNGQLLDIQVTHVVMISMLVLLTKRERRKKEQMRYEGRELSDQTPLSPSPSPPFIGEVGGDVLFISNGGASIYKKYH